MMKSRYIILLKCAPVSVLVVLVLLVLAVVGPVLLYVVTHLEKDSNDPTVETSQPSATYQEVCISV